jgi:hypothetical protein
MLVAHSFPLLKSTADVSLCFTYIRLMSNLIPPFSLSLLSPNMSTKMQKNKPVQQEMYPPSYEEIDICSSSQTPPTYYDTSRTNIEGTPVDDFHMDMFVSMTWIKIYDDLYSVSASIPESDDE